jgi:diguanylate cyclase (GGDEF)-like protein
LAPAYRWRLVDGLYSRLRPPLEGCGAVAFVAIIGAMRTGGWWFAAILVAGLLIMGGRILHYQRYWRASWKGGERRKTPDHWAFQFMLGALATASMWCALDLAALRAGDAMLLLVVISVQSGWLGAASTRNAASPATVVCQSILVLVPGVLCMLLSANHLLIALVPLAAIQFSATSGIARAIGAQITAAMISEQRLEAANARLTELSATDGLTGIANRRAFDAALQTEWGRAVRDGTELALLIIDVDYFKPYNDHYGHPAGDECLRLVAEATARVLRRPPDTPARFGGEEFVALLPGADPGAAVEVAERLRQAIADIGLSHEGSPFGQVTVSIGAACLTPDRGEDAQVLIDLADHALYEAKHAGRNIVRSAGRNLVLKPWTGGAALTAAPSEAGTA